MKQLKPAGDVTMRVADGEASGKLVVRAERISKRFGDHLLVTDFSTRIAKEERMGLVGPNGAGKTTLVRLLTGDLEPDSGTVKLGANVKMLVIDQKRDALDPDLTLRDALIGGGTDLVRTGDMINHVMAYMKDFLFLPEQAGTAVSRLSGGERGRLMLAMKQRHPSNLLVLDEPTNDLDLETLDLLQEMIAEYEGTVIVVSHDRDFLDCVCTSVILPQGPAGRWVEYAGGYSDMIAQRGEKPFMPLTDIDAPPKKAPSGPPKPQSSSVASKLSFKDKHALETLPSQMEKLQEDVSKVNAALAEPGLFEKNPERFNQFAKLLEKTQAELAKAEERWLELEMLREELEG